LFVDKSTLERAEPHNVTSFHDGTERVVDQISGQREASWRLGTTAGRSSNEYDEQAIELTRDMEYTSKIEANTTANDLPPAHPQAVEDESGSLDRENVDACAVPVMSNKSDGRAKEGCLGTMTHPGIVPDPAPCSD
jgi:hypothetical protein